MVWEINEKRFVDYYSLDPNNFVHVLEGDQYYLSNNLNSPEDHKKYLTEKGIEITDDYILFEFTTLYDRNGNEIYEGHIVSVWDGDNKTNIIRAVTFDEYELGYQINTQGGDICKLTKGNANSLEVIGNICQNKELLNS